MGKEFNTEWIIDWENWIFFFFAFNQFFQSTNWFRISYLNCRIIPFIYSFHPFRLILILKNNLAKRQNQNMNRGYCTSVFWLVNVSPVHHKSFFLKFLELHQLLQGRLYTELFTICSENFHCLVYHIKYNHNRDEVLQKVYIFQVKHFEED